MTNDIRLDSKSTRREFLGVAATAAIAGVSRNVWGDELRPMMHLGAIRRNVMRREVMDFTAAKTAFQKGKGDVAFLGGSITEMDGYRPMVCEFLTQKFPETQFNFIDAGIASTCSDVGAFRLETDVLEKCEQGAPDLFFVEFAVNDDQDGFFSFEHATRGMEGIIRHIKRSNPLTAIVMTFFVNENLMDKYREGVVPTSVAAHEAVAKRYGVSTINLAKEIQTQIDAGEITWGEFGGVHPAPRGNRICADMIATLLDSAWGVAPSSMACGTRDFPSPIDEFSYSNAGWRGFAGIETNVGSISDPNAGEGFRLYTPDWSKIPGGFRGRFAGVPCLCAERPGAEATFEFEGNALALYILAGPDAGVVESQIDDGEVVRIDAYHQYSSGLHYPRAVMLADALHAGTHKATIRLSAEKNECSTGTALRIMEIAVNRPEI
ncbi:MAG: SGNH/GDSL hydrolase family protein [Thermoguttaceae bacterium]|jgi:lysophospholipase L1-like esterase